jgi:hypothetical protein
MTEQTRTAAIMVAHKAATEAWVSLMDIAVKLEVPELDNASIALGAALKELLRAMLEFLISYQSVIDAEDRTLFSRLLLEMKE